VQHRRIRETQTSEDLRLEFLNTNAPGIQAVSAIISAIVTVVLVGITWRYVVLTKKIADTAERQLQQLGREEAAKRRQLLTMIKMLRMHLKTLPEEQSKGESMRKATLWDADDLIALQNLAAEVGMAPGQIAAKTGTELRRLSELVTQVKSTNPLQGVRWDQFAWDSWWYSPDFADTSEKAHIGSGGVSWEHGESFQPSLSERPWCSRRSRT